MRLLAILLLGILVGCGPARQLARSHPGSITSIRFLSEFDLPNGLLLDSTVIGGLSGIDYDTARNLYYLVCDDPSTKGPARYYTANIHIHQNAITSINISKVTALLNSSGAPYADITKDRIHSADVEALRYDPSRNEMIWSSEGQRIVRPGMTEIQQPTIVIMDPSGAFRDSLVPAQNIQISSGNKGIRHNMGFEGIAFDDSFKNIFVSIEEALLQDGDRAGTGDSTSWVRILKFDRESKRQVAQFAYELDAVPHAANPAGAFKVNGISDILYLGNDALLVVERAWSTGRAQSDVRVYIADLKNANNYSNHESIKKLESNKGLRKKLLLDFNTLGIFIDNVEGVCFGPQLENGKRSLLFVVDNNFNERQRNQFLLFEIDQ